MKRTAIAAGALALVVGVMAAVAGAGTVEDAIKLRQAVMNSQGTHLGAIVAVVQGEAPFSPLVIEHAVAVQRISEVVPTLFPEGTDVGDTRAKPEIWRERAKFAEVVASYQAVVARFVEIVKEGDVAAIGAELGGLGAACSGCHKPFRAEQN